MKIYNDKHREKAEHHIKEICEEYGADVVFLLVGKVVGKELDIIVSGAGDIDLRLGVVSNVIRNYAEYKKNDNASNSNNTNKGEDEELEMIPKDGYFKIPVGTKIVTPSGDTLHFTESEFYTSILNINSSNGGGAAHYWFKDDYDGDCNSI